MCQKQSWSIFNVLKLLFKVQRLKRCILLIAQVQTCYIHLRLRKFRFLSLVVFVFNSFEFYLLQNLCLCFLLVKCTRLRLITTVTLRSVTQLAFGNFLCHILPKLFPRHNIQPTSSLPEMNSYYGPPRATH